MDNNKQIKETVFINKRLNDNGQLIKTNNILYLNSLNTNKNYHNIYVGNSERRGTDRKIWQG